MTDHPAMPPSGRFPPEIQEALSRLAPWLQESGMEPGMEPPVAAPLIHLGERMGILAHTLAQHLRGSGLYRAGDELVTVDASSGQFKLMSARRAVAWLDDRVTFWRQSHGQRHPASINRQKIEEILASDAFTCKIPVLNGINPVKLPVRRKDGTLQLLRPGYDAESGMFTLHTGIDYDEDMDPDAARAYLLHLLRYFPFGDEERSRAVHVSAMLTIFCMGMLPPGARPPMFVWNANQVGSGKTRLAQMALIPVYGTASLAAWWERSEDFKKELDSAAQDFVPYLFFDDQSGLLKSGLLNGWLTSSRWSGRVMGGKERFYVPLRAATLVTGNHLSYSDDLFRRSLISDLFSPVQYDQRVLPADAVDITEEWLAAAPNRRDILAALWALVRFAEERETVRPARIARKIGSFEGWCQVIPRIVIHARLGDPTEKPAETQGNPLLHDARELARRALDDLVQGRHVHPVKLAELVPIARRAGLFVEKLGTLEDVYRDLDAGRGKWKQVDAPEDGLQGETLHTRRDPTPEEKREQAAAWLDRSTATGFGSLLKKLMNGLLFADSRGRNYQFGSREGARKATYVCTLK